MTFFDREWIIAEKNQHEEEHWITLVKARAVPCAHVPEGVFKLDGTCHLF